jgi:hypothetical protein
MLAIIFEIFKDLFCISLAFACGVFSFRYLSMTHRILFIQVAIYLVTYISVWLFKDFNNFIYNIGTFMEITLLLLSVHVYIGRYWMTFLLLALYSCYSMIYIFQLKQDPFSFANYSYAAGGIAVFIGYLFILYSSFTISTIYKKVAGIAISLGLLIYFGCNVPNFCMIGYLNDHKTSLGIRIFNLLNDSAANIRYFLMAYGFWLLKKAKNLTIVASK